MVNRDILKYDNLLVSVIIPVYNAEKYISETLESVINQTYRDLEIIVIDDCSKDSSSNIIKDIMKSNLKIIYHKQEVNAGVAVARNKGLELARGRFIAFLDSDDLWYHDKLEKQLSLMKEKNAAISYTAIEMIDETGQLIKGKRKVKETVSYKTLLKNTVIATSTVLIDRNIMGEFKMPLIRSGQDYATWLMLLRNGTIAYGINDALTKYRRSKNSLSSNKFKSVEQVIGIQRKQEKIGFLRAHFNGLCFIINAFKKHIL